MADWVEVDNLNDCTIAVTGGNLEISIPGGTAHDLFAAGALNSPQYLQSCSNDDFDVQCEIVGPLPGNNSAQGILVKASADNFIRFDITLSATGLRFYSMVYTSGTVVQKLLTTAQTINWPLHLRVNRVGDNFSFSSSEDGVNWTERVNFDQVITVNQVGFVAYTSNTNPAFIAKFNEFFVDVHPAGALVTLTAVESVSDSASFTARSIIKATLTAVEASPESEIGDFGSFTVGVPIKALFSADGQIDEASFSVSSKIKALLAAIDRRDSASFSATVSPAPTPLPDVADNAKYTVVAITRNYTIKYRLVVTLTSKAPSEYITLKFKFGNLVKEIDTVESVSIQVASGTDPAVASMRVGNHSVNGTNVYQLVKGGVSGVVYIVRANIIRGSERYSLAAYLPVLELS